MTVLTSGKQLSRTDHRDVAALTVQAELSVHTILLPPRLQKLQHNGVTATTAPHMTTQSSAAKKRGGNALVVMSGQPEYIAAPSIIPAAPIATISQKRARNCSGT